MTSRLLPEVILENREALHHLSVACHQRRHLRLRETVGFFRGVHRQALPAQKGKIINTTCSLKLEKSAIYAYILQKITLEPTNDHPRLWREGQPYS